MEIKASDKGFVDGENYMYFNDKDKAVVVLTTYKTQKKFGNVKIELSKELSNVITKSVENYPRTYLLSGKERDEPMSKTSFDKSLVQHFDIGINNLRSAYVTNFYAEHESQAERDKLAKLMLHSSTTAVYKYYKVDMKNIDEAFRENKPKERTMPKAPRPPIILPPIPKPKRWRSTFDAKEYRRKYRIDHPEKVKVYNARHFAKSKAKIYRQRMLLKLNTKSVKVPREITLDKYKIRYNAEKKMYESY
jgi:hypothetical protein